MDVDIKVTKLLQISPKFCKQRRRLLIAFFIRRVLIGMQFTIILPTAWAYVKTFHAKPWFLALLASLYHLSGALLLPVAGLLFDYYKITKELVIVFNFFEMIGNLLYALPYSRWFLIAGRLISGLGSAFIGVMSSEIVLITTKEERLAVLARMEVGHLVGMFLAPGIAFSFKWVDFKIGTWHIQSTNAPGLLCLLVWVFFQIGTVLMVRNLAQELSGRYNEKSEGVGKEKGEDTSEDVSLLQKQAKENTNSLPRFEAGDCKDEKNKLSSIEYDLKSLLTEMLTLETTLVFFASLLTLVFTATSDVTVPLFTQDDFGWSPVFTSIAYLVCGVEAFAVFSFISLYARRLEDEKLLITGLVFSSLSAGAFLLYSWQRRHYSSAVPMFSVAYFLLVIGLTTVQVPTKSLFSKIFPSQFQGLVQSLVVILQKIGLVLGPILGSYVFTHLEISMSIFFGMFLVSIIWGLFSVEGLRKRKEMYSLGSV